MGALTITVNNRGVAGDLRYAEVTAALSSSYATSGDTGLTASALGWDTVVAGIVTSQDDGFSYHYNPSNGNLLVYQIGVTSAATVAGDDNKIMATASVLGISGAGVAFQQALSQVTNATDLSTTPGNVRLLMFGI